MIFHTVIECILISFTTTTSQTPLTYTHWSPFYFHVIFVCGPLNLIRLAFRDINNITSGCKTEGNVFPYTNNHLPPPEPPRGVCIIGTFLA